MVVYGNGLLANKFKISQSISDYIIFASGVSNSGETRESEFERERKLFLDCCKEGKPIIYFGSCSVELPGQFWTPYIRHKFEMERAVLSKGLGVVFRLPNVVGHGGNKNTLFNYLCNSILSGDVITVRKNAVRSLIDMDDVVSLVSFLCRDAFFKDLSTGNLIRVTLPRQFSVEDIIFAIESYYGINARLDYSGEDFLNVQKSAVIEECIQKEIISFDSNYLVNLVNKYAKFIKSYYGKL